MDQLIQQHLRNLLGGLMAISTLGLVLYGSLHCWKGPGALDAVHVPLTVFLQLAPFITALVWLAWHTAKSQMLLDHVGMTQQLSGSLAARVVPWPLAMLCMVLVAAAQLPFRVQLLVCFCKWVSLLAVHELANLTVPAREPRVQMAAKAFLIYVLVPCCGLFLWEHRKRQHLDEQQAPQQGDGQPAHTEDQQQQDQQQVQAQHQQQRPPHELQSAAETAAAGAASRRLHSALYHSERRSIALSAKVEMQYSLAAPSTAAAGTPRDHRFAMPQSQTNISTGTAAAQGTASSGTAAAGARSKSGGMSEEQQFREAAASVQRAIIEALQAAAGEAGVQLLGVSVTTFRGCVQLVATCVVGGEATEDAVVIIRQHMQQAWQQHAPAEATGEIAWIAAALDCEQEWQCYMLPVALATCAVTAGEAGTSAAGAAVAAAAPQRPANPPQAASMCRQLHLHLPVQLMAHIAAEDGSTVLRVVVSVAGNEPVDVLFDGSWPSHALPTEGSQLTLDLAAAAHIEAARAHVAEAALLLTSTQEGEQQSLLCVLPLLLLPSEAACGEIEAVFQLMTEDAGGSVQQAYAKHFVPFTRDLALVLGAMQAAEQGSATAATVKTHILAFLDEHAMVATRALVQPSSVEPGMPEQPCTPHAQGRQPQQLQQQQEEQEEEAHEHKEQEQEQQSHKEQHAKRQQQQDLEECTKVGMKELLSGFRSRALEQGFSKYKADHTWRLDLVAVAQQFSEHASFAICFYGARPQQGSGGPLSHPRTLMAMHLVMMVVGCGPVLLAMAYCKQEYWRVRNKALLFGKVAVVLTSLGSAYILHCSGVCLGQTNGSLVGKMCRLGKVWLQVQLLMPQYHNPTVSAVWGVCAAAMLQVYGAFGLLQMSRRRLLVSLAGRLAAQAGMLFYDLRLRRHFCKERTSLMGSGD